MCASIVLVDMLSKCITLRTALLHPLPSRLEVNNSTCGHCCLHPHRLLGRWVLQAPKKRPAHQSCRGLSRVSSRAEGASPASSKQPGLSCKLSVLCRSSSGPPAKLTLQQMAPSARQRQRGRVWQQMVCRPRMARLSRRRSRSRGDRRDTTESPHGFFLVLRLIILECSSMLCSASDKLSYATMVSHWCGL